MTKIVVGVDGSPHSRRALLRAVEEARLREGKIVAVFVYDPPRRPWGDDVVSLPLGMGTGIGTRPPAPETTADRPSGREQETRQIAERRLERFVEDTLAGEESPPVDLVAIGSDQPAEVLVDQSANADLLVIGTRGLGGFAGMLLGSVAHRCIQRSRCPMLILPPEA